MIYLFYGNDVEKVRSKAFEWVKKAREKEPQLVYARLAREELTTASLEDITFSGGLFVKRLLVLIDDPFPHSRTQDEDEQEKEITESVFEEHIDELVASNNVIIVLAPKLSSAKAKKLVSKAEKAYEYTLRAKEIPERGFNANLVNALGARSREALWLEIIRAKRSGDAPEMLHGLLHWKARELMEKGSRKWTEKEARNLSLTLIELVQTARSGGPALATALERFALTI